MVVCVAAAKHIVDAFLGHQVWLLPHGGLVHNTSGKEAQDFWTGPSHAGMHG